MNTPFIYVKNPFQNGTRNSSHALHTQATPSIKREIHTPQSISTGLAQWLAFTKEHGGAARVPARFPSSAQGTTSL